MRVKDSAAGWSPRRGSAAQVALIDDGLDVNGATADGKTLTDRVSLGGERDARSGRAPITVGVWRGRSSPTTVAGFELMASSRVPAV